MHTSSWPQYVGATGGQVTASSRHWPLTPVVGYSAHGRFASQIINFDATGRDQPFLVPGFAAVSRCLRKLKGESGRGRVKRPVLLFPAREYAIYFILCQRRICKGRWYCQFSLLCMLPSVCVSNHHLSSARCPPTPSRAQPSCFRNLC